MIRKTILRSTIVIASFCASAGTAFSQCTVAIPFDAHVFDTSKTVSANGADIIGSNWICAGDTLVITSGFGSQTFFLEEGAVLFGGGGGSRTVYLKPGAQFDGGGGGSQMITYDDNSAYFNCGSVYPTYCHPLIYDYTNAPANGCSFGTAVKEISSQHELKISPDPAADFIRIDFSGNENHKQYLKIFSSTGEKIFEQKIKQFPLELNTDAMAEGIYFVILLDENASVTEGKFLIAR